jgi:hypothetical protein
MLFPSLQLCLVAVVVVIQIWLIPDALYELLSGRSERLIWFALVCGIGFLLALSGACWPRRSIENTSDRNHSEERSTGVYQQSWSQVEQERLVARWSHACSRGIRACAS